MNDYLDQIEAGTANLLSTFGQDSYGREFIEENVLKFASVSGVGELTSDNIERIVRKLETRFSVTMSTGIVFDTEEYRPWLDESRGDIDWFYWKRYKQLLNNNIFPLQVISVLDSITDQILDHLENPMKQGAWIRRGMVVGHVQSGKTANYIGLMNKAADAGYKVIIILAGMLNSLRNQTQQRVDSGFIGCDSLNKDQIGVGILSSDKTPAFFTTANQDFRRAIATQLGIQIKDIKEPVVFVIKKNKATMENLIAWLKNNNRHNLQVLPTIVIDDEADHASINTNSPENDPTTINKKIRELLSLFNRSSYVGYTATPFANVFIDPDSNDEMIGEDLFPRDFIISLDPPSNYFGANRIFSDNGDLDVVRIIDDYEDHLPLRHKKDHLITALPDSLKNAIDTFIICRAIRILRGETKAHNSMLINVSRFTAVQSNLKLLVSEYLQILRDSIINHYMLPENSALRNSILSRLKSTFDAEYSDSESSWSDIQPLLKNAVSPIGVIEVNSSSSAEPLDYTEKNYPNGRNVIAVGGLSLSRGLTLEGLTVSYFLRNSIMYDTLMQMGRWFGYRTDYEDLCRIYMTAEADSWYSYISAITEELRGEFARMKAAGMTPKDFGLCVRSHPDSLIVTARNKMRFGTKVSRQVSLEGRLVETAKLFKDKNNIEANRSAMEELVTKSSTQGEYSQIIGNHLWQKVPVEVIINFINRFENHPASQMTEKTPLIHYAEHLQSQGLGLWDVALMSRKNPDNQDPEISGFKVKMQTRKNVQDFPNPGSNGILFNKNRVASRGAEILGLDAELIQQIEKQYQGKNIPDKQYREVRTRPLLMVHLLDCQNEDGSIFENGAVAYGISFPGKTGNRIPEKTVEYVVNTVWWKNEYQDVVWEEIDGN